MSAPAHSPWMQTSITQPPTATCTAHHAHHTSRSLRDAQLARRSAMLPPRRQLNKELGQQRQPPAQPAQAQHALHVERCREAVWVKQHADGQDVHRGKQYAGEGGVVQFCEGWERYLAKGGRLKTVWCALQQQPTSPITLTGQPINHTVAAHLRHKYMHVSMQAACALPTA